MFELLSLFILYINRYRSLQQQPSVLCVCVLFCGSGGLKGIVHYRTENRPPFVQGIGDLFFGKIKEAENLVLGDSQNEVLAKTNHLASFIHFPSA